MIFTPNENINCRLGPGLVYDILDVALKDTGYPIDGVNLDRTWVRIMLDANRYCWVMTDSGSPNGDLGGVRVLLIPPTPTPTLKPTPVPTANCAAYKDANACVANPACAWVHNNSEIEVHYYCTNK